MKIDKTQWMQTVTGRRFYPFNPRPNHVNIYDIAHHLSMQVRWCGAVKDFYSVAQHSVHVAEVLPPEFRLWGLLHDATEAYTGDLIRPLKVCLPEYKEVELGIMEAVCEKFGLHPEEPPIVKRADTRICATERRDLLPPGIEPFTPDVEPYPFTIKPWDSAKARDEFLYNFNHLAR